jgi:hypothetical protein
MGPVWFPKAPGSKPVMPGSSSRSGYRVSDSRFYILEPKRNQTGPGTRPRDRTTATTGPKTRLGLRFQFFIL